MVEQRPFLRGELGRFDRGDRTVRVHNFCCYGPSDELLARLVQRVRRDGKHRQRGS